MLYDGYSFDSTGIHIWPFKSMGLIRWENVLNVISLRSHCNLITIITFSRKHNKTEFFSLSRDYVFSYFPFFDNRFFACLKIINDNLPKQIVCLYTRELASLTEHKPASNRIEELEHSALNAWLKLHPHKAYTLSQEIMASDTRNLCALKVLGLYYCYDKEDYKQAEQIFMQMIDYELYDPLSLKTFIDIKLKLNEDNGLEFLFEKLRSILNCPNYLLEFIILNYYMDHDKAKASQHVKYIKELLASYCNSFWQQALDNMASELS